MAGEALKLDPTNTQYNWWQYSMFGNTKVNQGIRMTYNGVPVMYVPKEFVEKGLFYDGRQYLQPGFLNRQTWDFMKPAQIDPKIVEGTNAYSSLAPMYQNPYSGYIIDASKYNELKLDGLLNAYDRWSTLGKENPPVSGIGQDNGKLVYVGKSGDDRNGELVTYDPTGNANLFVQTSESSFWGDLGRTLGKLGPATLLLNTVLPGVGTALYAGTQIGHGIATGNIGQAALNVALLSVPGAGGASAAQGTIFEIPGVNKAVQTIGETLGVSPGIAGAIVNGAVNMLANGMPLQQAMASEAARYAGGVAAEKLSQIAGIGDMKELDKILKSVTASSTKAILLNQDVEAAAKSSFVNSAVPYALQSTPGWEDLGQTAQKAITSAAISAAQGGNVASAIRNFTAEVFADAAVKKLPEDMTAEQKALAHQTILAGVQGKPLDTALQSYVIGQARTAVQNQVAQSEGWESLAQKQQAQQMYGNVIKPEDYSARQQGWEDAAEKQAAIKTYGPEVTVADYKAKEAGWQSADQKAAFVAEYGPEAVPPSMRGKPVDLTSPFAKSKPDLAKVAAALKGAGAASPGQGAGAGAGVGSGAPGGDKLQIQDQGAGGSDQALADRNISMQGGSGTFDASGREYSKMEYARLPEGSTVYDEKGTPSKLGSLGMEIAGTQERQLGALAQIGKTPTENLVPGSLYALFGGQPGAGAPGGPSFSLIGTTGSGASIYDKPGTNFSLITFADGTPSKIVNRANPTEVYMVPPEQTQALIQPAAPKPTQPVASVTPTPPAPPPPIPVQTPVQPPVQPPPPVEAGQFAPRRPFGGRTPAPAAPATTPAVTETVAEPPYVKAEPTRPTFPTPFVPPTPTTEPVPTVPTQEVKKPGSTMADFMFPQGETNQMASRPVLTAPKTSPAAAPAIPQPQAPTPPPAPAVTPVSTAAADAAINALAASTGQQIADVRAEFQRQFEAARASGQTADQALQTGIDRVAMQAAENQRANEAAMGRLGADVSGVQTGLQQLGTTTQQQMGDVNARVSDLQKQGMTQYEATTQALKELGSQQGNLAQQQAALGQQIGGVQSGLGASISDLANQFGTTTTGLQKQISQAQGQAGFGNLLTILGLLKQQEKAPPPLALVGEIKPYEFSTDLLAGIYKPEKSNPYIANEQLLNLTKGLV